MRHTDPRLTERTYMDERLLPIAAELSQLPAIEVVTSHRILTKLDALQGKVGQNPTILGTTADL
jgi:hypothetical protein